MATNSNARDQLAARIDNALAHPVDTAEGLYNTVANYVSNTSVEQMGEDGLRFIAGGLATAGIGKGAMMVGDAVGDATLATGRWLAQGEAAAVDTSRGFSPMIDSALSEDLVSEATVGVEGVSGAVSQADLDVLASNGVKFTPQNVIDAGKTPNGQIVFLETGNSSAGLQHIVESHASDFANIGVSSDKISSVVMQAVTEGKIVGYQGTGLGRPIYEITINGQPQRIAVTVGNNGFIVGANPAGSIK